MVARQGQQRTDPKTHDNYLEFQQGFRYSGIPGTADFQIAQYDTYGIRMEQNVIPEDKRVETYSTPQLWQWRHNDPKFEAELQWRIALPISTLILAMIALALSKVDPRQGRFAQLFPALLLYIMYINLLFVGRAWLQKGKIPPDIGLWWAHGFMLIIALILLTRFFGWRRLRTLWFRKQ